MILFLFNWHIYFLSSSVRRSSFRDKEKAARKLDTSFKDVLYATEQHETENTVSFDGLHFCLIKLTLT